MSRMTKHIRNLTRRRVVLNLIVVAIIAIVIETAVLSIFNRNSSKKTMTLLSIQVATILKTNETEEDELVESLKEEYILRAKAVAHYMEKDDEAENDITELNKLAELLEIDEINIFDSTGTIISGTEPYYYGYNFDSGEQISYFKPMLEDKTLSMCQDMIPNTAKNEEVMYAITWNEAGTEMVQIGIHPTRLLEQLKSNEVSEVVGNMPELAGYDIYVAEADTKVIQGATEKASVGENLSTLNLDLRAEDLNISSFKAVRCNGYIEYVKCLNYGSYVIVIVHSTSYDIKRFLLIELIVFIYILLAAIMIYRAINALMVSNNDKERQLSILKSMADIYYSMHLIDLENDTLQEYKAQFEVKKIANHTDGAAKMMVDTLSCTVKEEFLKGMLEFSDLKTLSERMKDMKIISSEFIGKRIGWTRASFITIKADRYGRPTEVMFTTRSIENEKQKEAVLIKNSNTDELTQLLNRRAYESEMNNVERNYENLVFVAFDVNCLKQVNDNLGHAAGDELLIGASSCISQVFRNYGKIFRTGGDEFVAIINVSREELEKLKVEFNNVVDGWKGTFIDELSISSGYVNGDEKDFKNIKEMASLADKRMYQNKSEYYRKRGIDRRAH